jgi:hypothetical protein
MYASFDEIYHPIAIPMYESFREYYTDVIGPTISLSDNKFNIDLSGNVILSSNLTVQGATTFSGQTNFPQGTNIDSSGNITITGQTNFPQGTNVDSSGNVTITRQTNFPQGTNIDSSGNVTIIGQTQISQELSFSQGHGYTIPTVNGGTDTTLYSVSSSNAYGLLYFAPTGERTIQMPQTASNGSWYIITNQSTTTDANIVVKNYNSTITYATISPCTSTTSAGNSIRLVCSSNSWIAS